MLDDDRGGAQPAAASNTATAPTAAAEVIAEGQHSGIRAAAGDEPAADRPVSSGLDSPRGPERVERLAEAGRARSAAVAADRVAELREQARPMAAREPNVAAELSAVPEPAVAPTAVSDGAWTSVPQSAAAQAQQVEQASIPAAQPQTPRLAVAQPAQPARAVTAPPRRRLSQLQIALIIAGGAVVFWLIVNAIAALGKG